MCVQSKQARKAVEARNLRLLELVHFNLCEMNDKLTKGGKKYTLYKLIVLDFDVYLLK